MMKKLIFQPYECIPDDVATKPWQDEKFPDKLDWITIREAGFDPDKVWVGLLDVPWKGHPKFSLILAQTVGPPWKNVAVSNESIFD